MYKHILIPIDGSDFSLNAATYAIKLAKTIGAKMTAINVTATYRSIAVGELAAHMDEAEYEKRVASMAGSVLEKAQAEAKASGVTMDLVHSRHAHPWEAIIGEAEKRGCDLILMASHGRRGISSLLIGSETKKVLTHTTIPVLVWRG